MLVLQGALSVVHDDLQVDHTLITPRILELDVNRVTMGKHNSRFVGHLSVFDMA